MGPLQGIPNRDTFLLLPWATAPVVVPAPQHTPSEPLLRSPVAPSTLDVGDSCGRRRPRLVPWVPWLRHFHRSFTLGELLVALSLLGGTTAFSVLAIDKKWSVAMTGQVAGYPVILVFAFASRNSLATFLLGIPFERALFWHKFIGGFVVVTLTWVHGARAILGGGSENAEGEKEAEAQPHGLILGALITAFPAMSLWFIRRGHFNVFFVLHILLILASAIASYIHGFMTFFIGLGLWAFDVCFRYLYLCMVTAPKTCTATRLPANVISLTFPRAKNAHFQVSVHIRVLGNWTRSLYDLVKENDQGPAELPVYWEGPYGAPEIDLDADKYKLFLLISGGIGITPLQSIANSLAFQHEEEGRPMRKIWFVWSCADKYMLGANFAHSDGWRGADSPPRLPLSFQPDGLSRLSVDAGLFRRRRDAPLDGALLHTELFLTRLRTAAELDGAAVRPQLQPFLRFGRPDLEEIFGTFRAYAEGLGEAAVGVLVCGPASLVHDVRRLCGSKLCDV